MYQQNEKRPLEVWSITGIAPTTTKELTIVPCDGCEHNQSLPALLQQAMKEERPHIANILSLPPLLRNNAPASQFRYRRADGVLAVSGCETGCTGQLLSQLQLRTPDTEIVIEPTDTKEEQMQALLNAIDSFGFAPELHKGQPFPRPFAARAKRKHFGNKIAHPKVQQNSSKTIQIEEPKQENSAQTSCFSKSSSPVPQRGYFVRSTPTPKSRWPWLVIPILLGIIIYQTQWFQNLIKPTQSHSHIKADTHLDQTNGKMREKPPLARKSTQITPKKEAPIPPKTTMNTPKNPSKEKMLKKHPKRRLIQAPTKRKVKHAPPVIVTRRPVAIRPNPTRVAPNPLHLKRTRWFNKRWTGGICKNAKSCPYSNSVCLSSVAYGYCSRLCVKYCPDKKGMSPSYCVKTRYLRRYLPSLPSLSDGLCISKCNFRLFPKVGCRLGARCISAPLVRDPRRKKQLCVPIQKR